MIKVFFFFFFHAELVAIFSSEKIYEACFPDLEKLAKKARMIVTESVEERELENY